MDHIGPGGLRLTGFTLIELLVVITIIVVLLALLVPALDKAIYQAELAVCGANQRAAAGGGITYAFDHKRYYPTRGDHYDWEATQIKSLDNATTAHIPSFDLRRDLRDYVATHAFLDPLAGGIRIGIEETPPEAVVFSNYQVYFGWGVVRPDGTSQIPIGDPLNEAFHYPKIKRIGQRFAWTEPQTGERHRFNVLIADRDQGSVLNGANPGPMGSHPDDERRMRLTVVQDPDRVTSVWLTGGPPRGLLDTNFALDDGSVRRFDAVGWGLLNDRSIEPRMAFIPENNEVGYVNNGWRAQRLPPAE